MRNIVVLLALALAGCASTEPTYQKVGGSASQIKIDEAVCRGEAEKANMAIGDDRAELTELFGMSREMRAVYDGCMAQRGYLRKND